MKSPLPPDTSTLPLLSKNYTSTNLDAERQPYARSQNEQIRVTSISVPGSSAVLTKATSSGTLPRRSPPPPLSSELSSITLKRPEASNDFSGGTNLASSARDNLQPGGEPPAGSLCSNAKLASINPEELQQSISDRSSLAATPPDYGSSKDAIPNLSKLPARDTVLEDARVQAEIYAAGRKADKSEENEDEESEDYECGCAAATNEDWIDAMDTKYPMKLREALIYLEQSGHCLDTRCITHKRALASKLGLKSNIDGHELDRALKLVHRDSNDLWGLKTDPTTYKMWRKAHRPSRPSDKKGSLVYFHDDHPECSPNITALEEYFHKVDFEQWKETGSVELRNIFAWWDAFKVVGYEETTIKQVAECEFEMCKHHMRQSDAIKTDGWLRNMLHSLTQQLIAQDPLHYNATVMLRSDHEWRLIAYPYYGKNALYGDNTEFKRMDLNIRDAALYDIGISMIRGHMTLDYDLPDSCPIILPGMHHQVEQWWERLRGRGQATDGRIRNFTAGTITDKDKEVFGTRWTAIPCSPGNLRMTSCLLPHGFLGPATRDSRSLMPQYVAIRDDLESLEIEEAGTAEQISRAHRRLERPPSTPTGTSNTYEGLPYKFPPTVQLCGLGPLSDALMGRRGWDDPEVLSERDLVLAPDADRMHDYLREWRQRAANAMVKTFQASKAEEKRAYGEKSFFYRADLSLRGMYVAKPEEHDPPPEFDQTTWNQYCS